MTSGKSLKLYNTLSRSKVDFVPLDPAKVRMYVCGPTVYDFAHIGNARPAIVFDVLFRLLRHVYGKDHVTYVRNITDVDDKINARAARDYPGTPLNQAIRHVTEKTANQYDSDMKALGNLEPTFQPRATDYIAQMVTLIQKLLDKDHAYVVRGAEGRETLFDVSSMPDYGALSRRDAASTVAGSRVEVKDHKRNPEDFVLWKESDPGQPGWDATFHVSDANRSELNLNENAVTIRGRPGWHIECSAMSEAYLGQTFDIHGGGLDLIFPHHENEIAQSRCAHGTHAMANIWMHNGFLQVEGQKMSKSLGNFFTIHQLLETTDFGGRKWPGEVLRLAMLMTHYRQPIDFSVSRLEEAQSILRKWADIKVEINRQFGAALSGFNARLPDSSPLLDDLNLSPIIADLHRLGGQAARGDQEAAMSFAVTLDLLGFSDFELESQIVANLDLVLDSERSEEVADAAAARLAALAAKDFAEADRIRNELAAKGIQLTDYKDPETGEKKTRWEIKR